MKKKIEEIMIKAMDDAFSLGISYKEEKVIEPLLEFRHYSNQILLAINEWIEGKKRVSPNPLKAELVHNRNERDIAYFNRGNNELIQTLQSELKVFSKSITHKL